jgi:hypothetical protein
METKTRAIKVRYSSVDGFRKTYTYATVEGAKKKMADLLGQYYDIGPSYAVSGDGIGKVQLEGATFEELGYTP